MKKVLSIMALFAFVLTTDVTLAAAAKDQNYWYGRLGARLAWIQQDADGIDFNTDTGLGGAIAFGYEFGSPAGKFRIETELAKQKSDFDKSVPVGSNTVTVKGTVDVTSVFVNGYYELPVASAFSLYVMGGLGYVYHDADATTTVNSTSIGYASRSETIFGYKAGTGVTWNITDRFAADLGYEYLGLNNASFFDSSHGHNVVLSVRFKF